MFVDATSPTKSQLLEPHLQDAPRWLAVYTYPRHEKAAAEHLARLGLAAYVPTVTKQSRWKDRKVNLHTPVFPGYLFTHVAFAHRNKVLSAPGVVRILSFNGRPAPIEDDEIEALKLCLDRAPHVERCSSLGLGDRVRVRSGVLQGLIGRISTCKGERRLIVPISLIHQSVAVEVDVDLLEFLSAS